MRKNYFVICILLIFLAETAVLAAFMRAGGDFRQDTVGVN